MTQPPGIKVLPSVLADRIAAGEVIERPASVAKELLENALDAGSRWLRVELSGGSNGYLRVADDGSGILAGELPLAVLRHATSKIVTPEDLDHITTLGFRGEALPSIGAVSRLTIRSKTAGVETGAEITVAGSESEPVKPWSGPPGTEVTVEKLFYNTPARKKFLKTESTEQAHVIEAAGRAALVNTTVHFEVWRDGELVWDLPAGVPIEERARKIIGPSLTQHFWPGKAGDQRCGAEVWIAPPEVNVNSARHIYLYVNRRFVRDRAMLKVVLDAYQGMVPKGRYPIVVCLLSIDPREVDVNVHPQKYEVRFAPQTPVLSVVHKAVTTALVDWHTRGQAAVKGAVTYAVPQAKELEDRGPATHAEHRRRIIEALAQSRPAANYSSAGAMRPRPEALPAGEPAARKLFDAPRAAPPIDLKHPDSLYEPPPEGFASLKAVGQARREFLLLEDDDGLVIMDQHAAHERVVYVKLFESLLSRKVPQTQPLLVPLRLELSSTECALFETHLEQLQALGFDAEPFGSGTIVVKTCPALLAGTPLGPLLRDLLAELSHTASSAPLAEQLRAMASRMACHAAVRAGDPLSHAEIGALLRQMDEVALSSHCPHGRPVAVRFSWTALERWFGR